MKKTLLPLVTVVALLAMPVSQAIAAPKPTPPAGNSGSQMDMSSSQMAPGQPAMSGWDMVKMRTTAKMRDKAARNAKLKGKPAQAIAASTYDAAKGPDYFGTTPNYASSPMPHVTWIAGGGNVILPIYDPTNYQLINPTDGTTVIDPCSAASPYLTKAVPGPGITNPNQFPTCANPTRLGGSMRPAIDPINKIPQLDLTKVSIAPAVAGVGGGIRKFIEPLPGVGTSPTSANTETARQNCQADFAGSNTPANAGITSACATAYLPVAVPDTTTYPGSDYYVIGVKDYFQQFSPDLPPTKLRGYYQINGAGGVVQEPNYLGPIIKATANVPVRVRFENHLAKGDGGDLFIPTDTTAMGAGTGPDDKTAYSTNRSLIHLHGGLTPWISDGTPHQWTTPVGYAGKYPKGVSVVAVPDMPAIDLPNTDLAKCPGNGDPNAHLQDCLGEKTNATNDGVTEFYYTNAQSARLMWYHDHSYGLTRLNVYAGEVSGYILSADPNATDEASVAQNALEAILPTGANDVPLVLQDKGFVPDNTPSGYFPDGQLTDQDPTWMDGQTKHNWGGTGALWFPHVYMPNQNPYDNSGAAAMGRWDYGPWFWPIFGTSAGLAHGEVANPYASPAAPWEPPFIPGTPSSYTASHNDKNGNPLSTSDVSLAPEAFVDTPVINGVAYPYMNVKPEAYRFRILNGANDRYWNLQMYCSAEDVAKHAPSATNAVYQLPNSLFTATVGGNRTAAAGEVPMVSAIQTDGFPADWPTDGRAGGVPDPAASVGQFLQIGTESGVLPNAVDVENQPVNYVYNRRDIIVLSISTHALLLGPAERADVVYDFSKVPAWCNDVVLYNDAPTPVPAFDPRNDYYSNNPDQTEGGGTPSTLPGYGPNTRTMMQFRIDRTLSTAGDPASNVSFDATAVKAQVPATFAKVQNKPIVPATAFKAAYGAGDPIAQSDVYSRIQSTSLSFDTSLSGTVTGIELVNPGSGYAPTVTISAPTQTGGVPAVGLLTYANGVVTGITVNPDNSGYRGGAAPVVTISNPVTGRQATAVANLSGTVKRFFNGENRDTRVITSITITDPGLGYTSEATLAFDTPPAAVGATTASGVATLDVASTKVASVTLLDGGNGYTTAPNVSVSPHIYVGGTDATARVTSMGTNGSVTTGMVPKAIQELFEMNYGRMNATMGVELPFTGSNNQTTQPMGYNEPVTEVLTPSEVGAKIGTAKDGTQIWKITHNGVDTHTIHFHLFDIQLINRVGWDGAIRPPDANEMGWKESVRMNPLEDAIVAMRPATPELPFKLPDSVRPLDPSMAADMESAGLSTTTGNAITFNNQPVNLGWEYVWHCHLLGHEENDMMRPVDFQGSPEAPRNMGINANTSTPAGVVLNWQNRSFLTKPNPNNPNGPRQVVRDAVTNVPIVDPFLTNYVVERADNPKFTGAVQTQSDKAGVTTTPWQPNGSLPAVPLTAAGEPLNRYVDAPGDGTWYYRVRAESRNGYSEWSAPMTLVVDSVAGTVTVTP
jgi:FtsP/CotA-like multicopper oxidase with cupredoxin domain